MALTYSQLKALVDQAWIDRVEASLVAAAIAISVDAPATPIDVRRDNLARLVVRESAAWAQKFALGAALGFTAGANLTGVSDANLDGRISAIFNDYLMVL